MNCPYCHRVLTKDVLANKKRIAKKNKQDGLRLAQANGKHIGRPRKAQPKAVLMWRSLGRSYAEIAKELGCSTGAVRYAIGNPLEAANEDEK
jgi:hypothetical protein